MVDRVGVIFVGGGTVKTLVQSEFDKLPLVKTVQLGSVRTLTQTPEFRDQGDVWEAHVTQWLDREMAAAEEKLEGCARKVVIVMAAEPDPGRFQAEIHTPPQQDLQVYGSEVAKEPMFRLNVGIAYKVAQWVGARSGFSLMHISTSYVYMEHGPLPNKAGDPVRQIPADLSAGSANGLHPFDNRSEQNGHISEFDYAPYLPEGFPNPLNHSCCELASQMRHLGSVSDLSSFTQCALQLLPAHIQQVITKAGVNYSCSKLLAELAVQSAPLVSGNAYSIVRLPTMVGDGCILGQRPCGGAKYALNVLSALKGSDEADSVACVLKKSVPWQAKSRSMCSYMAAAAMIASFAMQMKAHDETPQFRYEHAAGSYSQSDAQYHAAIAEGLAKLIPADHPKQVWLARMISALAERDLEASDVGAHTTMAMYNQGIDSSHQTDFVASIHKWLVQLSGSDELNKIINNTSLL